MEVAVTLDASKPAHGELRILVASTLGTLIECYDFFLYGSLASVLSKQFFAGLSEQTQFIFALLAFGVGFAFRPLGALIFGRLGDTKGRKSTFVVTLLLMGCATFGVGLLPGYQQWGSAAPALLIFLRVLQGIGIGGEFGGAAIFVAEHAPPDRRGANTSWIQATGALGMVLALLVVYACRSMFGSEFDRWAWRIPFLLSGVMLIISLYVRLSISESLLFLKMKAEGRTSRRPIAETFGSWANLKMILIALFGLITGVTTVIYTAQIYALFFLSRTLRVDGGTTGLYVAIALTAAIPLFWVFGTLSDRIGRKPVILTGCLLGALAYFPVFHAITHYANPALESAVAASPVTVYADRRSCNFQFDPIGQRRFVSECDRVKALLSRSGIPYRNADVSPLSPVVVWIGDTHLQGADLEAVQSNLERAGYPASADPARINGVMVVGMLFLMSIFLAMVFAPLSAALVEMFPARIRYTALSFPYHVGNGLVGGFFPAIAFAIVSQTGNIYAGLWYPVGFSFATAIVGFLFLKRELLTGIESLNNDTAC